MELFVVRFTSIKNICLEAIQNSCKSSIVPGLNRGMFLLRIFTNGLNMGCSQQNCVKKPSIERKYFGKKNLVIVVSKEGHADSIVVQERTLLFSLKTVHL